MMTYLVAILCVVGLAIGQVLFKLSSSYLTESGSFFDAKVVVSLSIALCLYGFTSVAWVWVLQRVELGRVYPVMALAFVMVPLGSHLVFGERFHPQYFSGVVLIVIGIIVAVRAY